MKLSEPAENLWRTHRDTLHRIADDIAGPSRLLLGGGTILNADWGHRQSIDIDVLPPERRNVTDLHPGRRLDLAKARRDPRDLLNRPMTFRSARPRRERHADPTARVALISPQRRASDLPRQTI